MTEPQPLGRLLPGVLADLARRHGVNPPTTLTDRTPMTAIDRAQTYAAIFLNAGEKWRGYVPVDATVSGDTVHLQGVRMERGSNGWRLETNGEAWIVRAKDSAA